MAEEDRRDARESPRLAIEREVMVRFVDLRDFATEYAANISLGGMFLRMRRPPPVGTLLAFDFTLADGVTVVSGSGEVAWVRSRATAVGPAGVGVRFRELDALSRDLIFRLVDHHIQRGGTPFDLDAGPDDSR